MPSYTITEPHPTVAQNTYIHAGRGGAGNHFRAPQTTSPRGVPTTLPPLASTTSGATAASSASSSGRFYSGRGGAGNAHSQAERPVLSFEDEFSRADRRDKERRSAGYHVGRGGAGNFATASTPSGVFTVGASKKSARSDSASSVASSSSAGSVASGFMRRLSGAFRN